MKPRIPTQFLSGCGIEGIAVVNWLDRIKVIKQGWQGFERPRCCLMKASTLKASGEKKQPEHDVFVCAGPILIPWPAQGTALWKFAIALLFTRFSGERELFVGDMNRFNEKMTAGLNGSFVPRNCRKQNTRLLLRTGAKSASPRETLLESNCADLLFSYLRTVAC
jgi:hypothetical protein